MKKNIILLVIVMCLVGPILANGGAMKKVHITEQDLPHLIGLWEGYRSVRGSVRYPTSLSIESAVIPFMVSMIQYHVQAGGNEKSTFNAVLEDGRITYRKNAHNWIVLFLYVSNSGDMELRGEYCLEAQSGIGVFRAELFFTKSP